MSEFKTILEINKELEEKNKSRKFSFSDDAAIAMAGAISGMKSMREFQESVMANPSITSQFEEYEKNLRRVLDLDREMKMDGVTRGKNDRPDWIPSYTPIPFQIKSALPHFFIPGAETP